MKTGKPKLLFSLSMTVFGTVGVLRKFIPLPSGFVSFARGLVGALFLMLIMLIKKEKPDKAMIKKNGLKLLLSGALIGFNWVLLFESYRFTTIATSTLCYYMMPVFLILVSPFFFAEKLTLKKLLCVLASVIGIVFVSGILETKSVGKDNLLGIIFGVSAAVLYAIIMVINKKTVGVKAYDKTVIQLFSAALVVLPYSMLTESISVSDFTPVCIVLLAVMCIFHTGISYAVYFGQLEKLSAQTVALFSYIDPVVAVIISAFLPGEGITVLGIVGAVLILGSAAISEM